MDEIKDARDKWFAERNKKRTEILILKQYPACQSRICTLRRIFKT